MDETTESCPNCGEPIHEDDLYCGSCGAALASPPPPDLAPVASTDDDEADSVGAPTVLVPAADAAPPPPDQPMIEEPDDQPAQPSPERRPVAAEEPIPHIEEATPFTFPPPPGRVEPAHADAAPAVAAPLVVAAATANTPASPAAARSAGTAAPPQPQPKRHRKAPMIIVCLAALLIIGGLVWALIVTRQDLDDANANSSANAGSVADLTAQNDELQQQLDAANAELETTKAGLTKAQEDLAAEQQARATDATTLQQTQDELKTTQDQLAQLQALFPMDEVAFRTADPTGAYDVSQQAAECTLAECGSIGALTITIPNKSTVSGNRTNGALNFDGSSYVNTGSVEAVNSPTCNGAPAPATYELTLHATEVIETDGALQATKLAGTYTETVTSGDCAGQFRSYDLALTKKS